MANETVVDRIAARIRELGTNPSAVALEAGLSRSAVLDILKGKAASPRLATLQKLTKPLHCSLEYLTTGAETSERKGPRLSLIDEGGDLHNWPSLEAEVYRPSTSERKRPHGKHSELLPGWEVTRYSIADNSLSGAGILKGDIIEAVWPMTNSLEVPLLKGRLVVIRHVLPIPRLEQTSARRVMSATADKVMFSTQPANIEDRAAIAANYVDEGSTTPNTYRTDDDGYVEVVGVVSSVHRSYSVTEFSRIPD